MSRRKHFYFAALSFLLHVMIIACHPQCLGGGPPIFVGSEFKLCKEYENLGCCKKGHELNLIEKYNRLRSEIPTKLWTTCGGYIREILCQRCSPHAAHMFELKHRSHLDPALPGLCKGFCLSFFSSCSEVIPYLLPEAVTDREFRTTLLKVASQGGGADQFCSLLLPKDIDYCYPKIKENRMINSELGLKKETVPGCLCVEEVLTNIRSPLFAVHAGDGTGRVFIGEQIGEIHILFSNGSLSNKPFLDITSSIKISTNGYSDERGLLGMAFHPNYTSNGRFFVVYTRQAGKLMTVQLSEFRVSAEDENKADVTSEIQILGVRQPYANHNGGQIFFGADNYLYFFEGDGGYRNDPLLAGQDMSLLLGKALRIDINNKDRGKNYAIPLDNPFARSSNRKIRKEIYSYGLRNPWRCGIDPGDSVTGYGRGRIICGDVGQSAYEELNLIESGANYGWGGFEGPGCFDVRRDVCKEVEKDPRLTAPIYMYNHTVGKCVIGGNFYRGTRSPRLNGIYIYADISTGRLYQLEENTKLKVWKNKEVSMCGKDVCKGTLSNYYHPSVLSFGQDEAGEVYILSTKKRFHTKPAGSVYRIVDPWVKPNHLSG